VHGLAAAGGGGAGRATDESLLRLSLLANALDAAQRTAGIAAMPLEAASEHDLNWATNILELGH